MRSAMAERAKETGGSSLTLRIAALFAGSVHSILLLSGVVLYWGLAKALHDEDARLLRENLAAIRAAYLASTDPTSVLEDELVAEPGANRAEPFYLRFIASDGAVLETSGMASTLPRSTFDDHAASGGAQPQRWRAASGRTYLLYRTDVGGARGGILQGALDVTPDEILLAAYRRLMLSVILAGSLLAALAGWLTARQGLRPLSRLTRSVQQISARRLDQRIGAQAWPRELADLAMVFDEMLGRLEDSFGRLYRYSADLAHELRTPLTNLRGEAEVALRKARSAEEYERVLSSSLEEFTRLTDLVDRLLFLARADAGAAALLPEQLNGGDEVARVSALFSALAEERGVRIDAIGAGYVHADPVLFRRAVANLVANSLAHTPSGGRVEIALEAAEGGARVTVRDTGCGIPAEHLAHVTERFYQADPARRRNGQGAGLGLALVRSIVELHDGALTLASEPERGTEASLFFPRSAERGSAPLRR